MSTCYGPCCVVGIGYRASWSWYYSWQVRELVWREHMAMATYVARAQNVEVPPALVSHLSAPKLPPPPPTPAGKSSGGSKGGGRAMQDGERAGKREGESARGGGGVDGECPELELGWPEWCGLRFNKAMAAQDVALANEGKLPPVGAVLLPV